MLSWLSASTMPVEAMILSSAIGSSSSRTVSRESTVSESTHRKMSEYGAASKPRASASRLPLFSGWTLTVYLTPFASNSGRSLLAARMPPGSALQSSMMWISLGSRDCASRLRMPCSNITGSSL
ncbi:hypothetical protein SGRIM128S_05478 [Streptomyces griseomycini]